MRKSKITLLIAGIAIAFTLSSSRLNIKENPISTELDLFPAEDRLNSKDPLVLAYRDGAPDFEQIEWSDVEPFLGMWGVNSTKAANSIRAASRRVAASIRAAASRETTAQPIKQTVHLLDTKITFNRSFQLGSTKFEFGSISGPRFGTLAAGAATYCYSNDCLGLHTPAAVVGGGTKQEGHNATNSVRQVQSQLKTLGYYTGGIDGINGPKTKTAVRAFQADEDLTVDGIAGPETRMALAIVMDRQGFGRSL